MRPEPLARPDALDALTPEGAEAFARLWKVFLATVAAEDAIEAPHDHSDPDDCPRCHSGRARHYSARTERLVQALRAGEELKVAQRVYAVARQPPAPGKRYYVSAVKGDEYVLLAGPYGDPEEAARMVRPARDRAYAVSREAAWWAYGICSHGPAADGTWEPGRLNGDLNP